MKPLSLTPRRHWNHWAWLRGAIDIYEPWLRGIIDPRSQHLQLHICRKLEVQIRTLSPAAEGGDAEELIGWSTFHETAGIMRAAPKEEAGVSAVEATYGHLLVLPMARWSRLHCSSLRGDSQHGEEGGDGSGEDTGSGDPAGFSHAHSFHLQLFLCIRWISSEILHRP